MTPNKIILNARMDGVALALTDAGTIKATGDAAAVNRWLPLIREHKAAIIEALEFRDPVRPKVGAGGTASRWWLLHFADREPLEISCTPPATHADILERHPDAVAAEPFEPTIRQPSAPLTASEETAIRAWLALIEETDPATIAEVIGQCQRDADARDYFTRRAMAELSKPDPFPDDRRTCDQCANLAGVRCMAAKRGEILASRNYEPIRDLPRRCEGYMPGPEWIPERRKNG